MNRLRNNHLTRFLWILLAFQIFNASIDMPDGHSDSIAEDLSINDQETFIELLVEKILGYDHAIEEHDEQDDDTKDFEMTKSFNFYFHQLHSIQFNSHGTDLLHNTPAKNRPLPEYFSEINPPPPKA